EAISPQRAMRTSRLVVRMKHEVIHDELTASRKQVSERFLPALAFEEVFLRHALPRQAALQPAHVVALASESLLFFQERSPCREPFFVGYHRVIRCQIVVGHRESSLTCGGSTVTAPRTCHVAHTTTCHWRRTRWRDGR